ncbi:MAG: class I SAM-dependent methyltransferase [Rhodospirillaceae bacterium]|nr:class I SAM-dependent methyltransferase [Rhodospirillaceae bacterium]
MNNNTEAELETGPEAEAGPETGAIGHNGPEQSIYERSITLRFLLWLGRALNPFSNKKETQAGETHWLDEIDDAPENDEGLSIDVAEEKAEGPNLLWPKNRLNMVEQLWGDGYITPGGEEYIKEYLPLLALTKKHSLLLLGASLGGIGRTLVEETGVWVTGYEQDVELAEIGAERCVLSAMQRRAPVKKANFETLQLKPRSFDFAMSLESLYTVEHKKELFASVADSLRTDGELIYTDLVLPNTEPPNDAVKKWMASEVHKPHLWPVDVTQSYLGTLNFDVRPYTDITGLYRMRVLMGWLKFLDTMNKKKLTALADSVINECAYWARLISAIDSGGLKVYSFHAYKLMEKKK